MSYQKEFIIKLVKNITEFYKSDYNNKKHVLGLSKYE